MGVGVIDNMIYALGGSQGANHHNSVERSVGCSRIYDILAVISVLLIDVGFMQIK